MLDYVGRRFGRLTVLRFHGPRPRYQTAWLCRCDCGSEKVVQGSNLQSGTTQSCGCLMREEASRRSLRHGHTNGGGKRRWSPEYTAWAQMKQRCYNPLERNFSRYGGRGISVCERWRDNFECFLADMESRPSSKHSIDRIDVNGNYEPGNCRWATHRVQMANRRCTRRVMFNGTLTPLTELAKEYGVNISMLSRRIERGWSVERALTTPKAGTKVDA
jgi:hypothetical protein